MFRKQEQLSEPLLHGTPNRKVQTAAAAAVWLPEAKAHAETPRSNISAGLEASTFGSGSSVLSQYEPPTEADLTSERAVLAQLLDHRTTSAANLEELEAVINKLQAVYFYRQGLKALAEQSMGSAVLGTSPHCTATSSSWMNNASFASTSMSPSSGSFGNGQGFLYDPPSSSIPGPSNSIWRMDASNRRPSSGTAPGHLMLNPASTTSQYPGVVSAQELASLARVQYQLYQDTLRQYKKSRHDRGQKQMRQSRSTRHSSTPVMLRAPQWADPSWHPMTAVIAKGTSSGSGTGVFIPLSKQNSMGDDQSGGTTEKMHNTKPGLRNWHSDQSTEGWSQ